jgi:hypothetical protein
MLALLWAVAVPLFLFVWMSADETMRTLQSLTLAIRSETNPPPTQLAALKTMTETLVHRFDGILYMFFGFQIASCVLIAILAAYLFHFEHKNRL